MAALVQEVRNETNSDATQKTCQYLTFHDALTIYV